MITETIFGNRGASSSRRSFNPLHPRDPVLAKIFGRGRRTAAGVEVDVDRALAIPTVLRGTSIIANTMMRMTRDVFLVTE